MKGMLTRHLVPAMLAMVFVLSVFPALDSVRRLVNTLEPAVSWDSVKVITPIVEPGGILYMVYTATVNKQCPSDLRGFLVAEDGTVPVRFPPVSGGYTKPSDDPVEIRVSITIPKKADNGLAPLHSGRYTYRTVVTRYCPDGVEDDNSVPEAPFTLEVSDNTKGTQ
jgi:hypothetical protein